MFYNPYGWSLDNHIKPFENNRYFGNSVREIQNPYNLKRLWSSDFQNQPFVTSPFSNISKKGDLEKEKVTSFFDL